MIASLLFASLVYARRDMGAKDIFNRIHREVVLIRCAHASGSEDSGTGFYYKGRDLIVTAYHVIKGATQICITDSETCAVSVPAYVFYDEAADIAILSTERGQSAREWMDPKKYKNGYWYQVTDKSGASRGVRYDGLASVSDLEFLSAKLPPVNPYADLIPASKRSRPKKESTWHATLMPQALSAVQMGETIFTIGYPNEISQSITSGIVSRITPDAAKPMIQITASINPGSSGSPVVNAQGDLVGVVDCYLTGGQLVNFAVSATRIDDILRYEIPYGVYLVCKANMALRSDSNGD